MRVMVAAPVPRAVSRSIAPVAAVDAAVGLSAASGRAYEPASRIPAVSGVESARARTRVAGDYARVRPARRRDGAPTFGGWRG